MKILITNDDGYEAKGISVLVNILRPYGDLTVVAPKRHQSGMSMAVNMDFRPLGAKKIYEAPGERRWYFDSTPAGCVKFAIDNVMYPEKPNLVVSGINHGNNVATATLYSGTLGAAKEGAMNGIAAIGVSLDSYHKDSDFSAVEQLLPPILDVLMARPKYYGLFYNVNFPNLPASEIKGVKVCHMGRTHWEKEYSPFKETIQKYGKTISDEDRAYFAAAEEGEEFYVMAGEFTDNGDSIAPADHLYLEEGYITVTPENIDNTDLREKMELGKILDGLKL